MNELLPRLGVPVAKEPHRTSWFDGDLYVFPIREARIVRYSGNVHNLEVEGSNSYVVEGATLHNCLGKDLRALTSLARSASVSNELLSAALNVNDRQAGKAIEMAEELIGPVAGKKVSILGLAFKANTDDIRESTSILLAESLLSRKAVVTVYDPRAMGNARQVLGDRVQYAKSARDCLSGSECCFVATGWDEFKKLRPGDFKSLMASPVVVDGRRIYDQRPFRMEGILIGTVGTGPPLEE
jgi:UDPglucose 6-dehydrogenase